MSIISCTRRAPRSDLPVSIDTSRPRSRALAAARRRGPHQLNPTRRRHEPPAQKACAASSIAAFACAGVTSATRAVTPPSIGVRADQVAFQAKQGSTPSPSSRPHHLAVQHRSRVDIRAASKSVLDLLPPVAFQPAIVTACARQRQAARWNFAAHGGSGPIVAPSPTSIGATSTLLLPT